MSAPERPGEERARAVWREGWAAYERSFEQYDVPNSGPVEWDARDALADKAAFAVLAAALEQAAQDALNKAHVWHHPESSSYYLGTEGDNPDHLSVDIGTPQEALEQAREEERLRVWRVVLSRLDSGKPHQLYNRAEIESIVAQAVSAASLLSAPEVGDRPPAAPGVVELVKASEDALSALHECWGQVAMIDGQGIIAVRAGRCAEKRLRVALAALRGEKGEAGERCEQK